MNDFENVKIWLLTMLKNNQKDKLSTIPKWHDIDVAHVAYCSHHNIDIVRDVVWNLCSIGILRPGCYSGTGYSGGTQENYFCTTLHGAKWLQSINIDNYISIPRTPSEFLGLFDKNIAKFGDAFNQRVSEAVECYNMQLYIACHAMVGSAIESVLLYLLATDANINDHTRQEIFNDYKRGSTKRLEDNTIAKMPKEFRDSYKGLCSFIKDFRNNAAHGEYAEATESSAYLALVSLYRFSNLICKK